MTSPDPTARPKIVAGMAGGAAWAIGVLAFGAAWRTDAPLALAFLPVGLALALPIGRLAQRRFFDPDAISGGPLHGPAEIDRRVVQNTLEQAVLALCLWPPLVVLRDGATGPAMALGLSFLTMRLLFWIGYHRAPPLRALGFAGTFYPTILTAVWTLWLIAT